MSALPNQQPDIVYTRNAAKFWGVTPWTSIRSSQAPMSRHSQVSNGSQFHADARKFFGASEPPTPGDTQGSYNAPEKDLQAYEPQDPNFTSSYQKNVDKFYLGSSTPWEAGSQQDNPEVDQDSLGFQLNARRFYKASDPPSRDSFYLRANAEKFYGDGSNNPLVYQAPVNYSQPQAQAPQVDAQGYTFRRHAADFYGTSRPSSISSNRSQALISAAKRFFQ